MADISFIHDQPLASNHNWGVSQVFTRLFNFKNTLCASLLIGFFLGSSTVQSEPVSCQSMELDPKVQSGGKWLAPLGNYYEGADGLGGLGCWVHPHPNSQDFVVTPYSWGRVPGPGKQGLIDDVFQAITDSHLKLLELGTLDFALFILLNDINKPESSAEAFWIKNNECWIQVGPQAGYGSYGPAHRDTFKSTMAHEIGHCFLMENISGYSPETYGVLHKWWDESGAEFLSAMVYPEMNHEHVPALKFDLDGTNFLQPYQAVVVLQHYANEHDNPAVLSLLERIHANSSSLETLRSFLENAGLDEFYQDFTVVHFKNEVKDPGGGTMPVEAEVIPFDSLQLDEDEEPIQIGRLHPYRLNLLKLEIPMGYDVLFEEPADVNNTFRATVSVYGKKIRIGIDEATIKGNCDHSLKFPVLFTTLHTGGVDDIELHYRLKENRDCDCEDRGRIDACLVGRWEMEKQSMAKMFGFKPDLHPESGRIVTSFSEGGNFAMIFDNLTYFQVFRYRRRGNLKSEIQKDYGGIIQGCVDVSNATRLDGAAPIQAYTLIDGVERHTWIRREGQFVTTDKTEMGFEHYHWPHVRNYYKCSGNEMSIGTRKYQRVAN